MRHLGLLLVMVTALACWAQERPIDTANSTITIHVYKSGLFSFAGHDHIISAPIVSGVLDETKPAIEFTVRTYNMQVNDPGESDKNKAEIRDTMLGPKLLEAERYPEIKFHSTEIRQLSPSSFEVHGKLELHGMARELTLEVKRDGERYTGQSKLKQTDFGLTPVTVAGGTVKVKDEVMVEFSIRR